MILKIKYLNTLHGLVNIFLALEKVICPTKGSVDTTFSFFFLIYVFGVLLLAF